MAFTLHQQITFAPHSLAMRLLLSIVFSAFAFFSQGQHPTVSVVRHSWDWNANQCLYRWSVICSNSSSKTYAGIKFKLTLRRKADYTVIYSKIHTTTISLGPNETVPSTKFQLAGEICGLDDLDSMADYYLETEVISAW